MFFGCRATSRMSFSHTPASVWRVSAPWVPWSLLSTQSLPKSDFWVSFLELLGCFLEVVSYAFFDLFFVSVFLVFLRF